MQTIQKNLLPQKLRWTQISVSRHLRTYIKTVKYYAETIAIVIPDYRAECLRNADGSIRSGMHLSPYQAWVVCQLIMLGRTIRQELNGTPYRRIVKLTAFEKRDLLSKTSWRQQESSNSQAA